MESGGMIACARCGTQTDSSNAMYTSDGMICAGCEDAEIMSQTWAATSNKLFGSAIGSVLAGVTCYLIDLCFAVSIFAIVSGLGAIAAVMRVKEYRDQLGTAKTAIVIVLGVIGASLGAMKLLLTTVLTGIVALS